MKNSLCSSPINHTPGNYNASLQSTIKKSYAHPGDKFSGQSSAEKQLESELVKSRSQLYETNFKNQALKKKLKRAQADIEMLQSDLSQ